MTKTSISSDDSIKGKEVLHSIFNITTQHGIVQMRMRVSFSQDPKSNFNWITIYAKRKSPTPVYKKDNVILEGFTLSGMPEKFTRSMMDSIIALFLHEIKDDDATGESPKPVLQPIGQGWTRTPTPTLPEVAVVQITNSLYDDNDLKSAMFDRGFSFFAGRWREISGI